MDRGKSEKGGGGSRGETTIKKQSGKQMQDQNRTTTVLPN